MTQTPLPSLLQPTMGYAIFHQPRQGVGREAYEENLRELHARVTEEAAALAQLARKVRADLADRESSFLRSSLSQFLHTPLRSDEVDVRRLLGDTLERAIGRALTADDGALLWSSVGEVLHPSGGRAAEKRLAGAGRAYVEALGFLWGKAEPPVYESLFVVRGGSGLDALEHIVRDRIGIGEPPHGVHVSYFSRAAYALHNLVLERSDGAASTDHSEIAVFLEKPGVSYGEFRDGFARIVDRLMEEMRPQGVDLWQRKLGLGSGAEFVLRIRCAPARAAETLSWIAGVGPDDAAGKALVEDGRVVIKARVG
jgi:hypothetical protein